MDRTPTILGGELGVSPMLDQHLGNLQGGGSRVLTHSLQGCVTHLGVVVDVHMLHVLGQEYVQLLRVLF